MSYDTEYLPKAIRILSKNTPNLESLDVHGIAPWMDALFNVTKWKKLAEITTSDAKYISESKDSESGASMDSSGIFLLS